MKKRYAQFSIREAQLAEVNRANSGFHVIGIPRDQSVREATTPVVAGETFADTVMTVYVDPSFIVCLNTLVQCKTPRQRAQYLRDYLPDQDVYQMAYQVMLHLGRDKAADFLANLNKAAPEYAWTDRIRELIAS
jgi:hypothetical protein